MDSVFLDNQLMDEMFKPSQDENPSQFFIASLIFWRVGRLSVRICIGQLLRRISMFT